MGVFDRTDHLAGAGHEQVVFCQDPASGLRAIVAIHSTALGPGLGGYIFTGLSQNGGVNAINFALVGTIGIVILALVLDLILVGIGRLTIPRGIRA